MTNAWALSALWVGLALAATLRANWLRISTALSEIVVGTVAQMIVGVIRGIGGLHSATPQNQLPSGTKITRQLNKKQRRCAIADLGFAMSCVFGAIGLLQPAA
ncbi:MAG: hypothetical protein WA766_07565 [Candidatus Acidiferrales bacterium]|jgi:hypothetical protein